MRNLFFITIIFLFYSGICGYAGTSVTNTLFIQSNNRSGDAIITSEKNTTVIYNVKDFGALGDGITLDSKAINLAIEPSLQKAAER